MGTANQVYSVYVSDAFVELRSLQNSEIAYGRFICSQSNYHNILEFASNLAKHKNVPLKDYTAIDG